MDADKVLVLVGVGALIMVVLLRARKANTTSPGTPVRSGVIGVSPLLNPSAPKTPGDFSRFDRSLEQSYIVPRVAGYHDPVYDSEVPSVVQDASLQDSLYDGYHAA